MLVTIKRYEIAKKMDAKMTSQIMQTWHLRHNPVGILRFRELQGGVFFLYDFLSGLARIELSSRILWRPLGLTGSLTRVPLGCLGKPWRLCGEGLREGRSLVDIS